MTTTVTAYFARSNGTEVHFTGNLIRQYIARNGVTAMVEVATANGAMHAQAANAKMTIVSRKPVAVQQITANKVERGMKIWKGTLTGTVTDVTIQWKTSGATSKNVRLYVIETDAGQLKLTSGTKVTLV